MSLNPESRGVKPAGGRAWALSGKPPPPGPLLAAVSGGADSVALLRLLAAEAPSRGWQIVVGHVDHGLRPSSAQDAVFVQELAGSLGLDFRLARVKVNPRDGSPEEAARLARRRALAALADAAGALTIALGHHAGDQAETLIMRFFTGTGPTGLAGMRPHAGRFWRPLLGIRGDQLRASLRDLGQDWREDPSNADPAFPRNQVRRAILPLAEELLNPKAVGALCRLAAICVHEEDDWNQWCSQWGRAHSRREGASLCLAATPLARLSLGRLRRILRWAWGRTAEVVQGPALEQLDLLSGLARGAPGRSLNLSGGMRAWREVKDLRLDASDEPAPFFRRLDRPGRVHLPHLGKDLVAQVQEAPARISVAPGEAWLPLERLAWPLTLRSPRPGDVFHPLGAPGKKKLGRFFNSQKTPVWWRARAVVVSDEGGIWWVGPLRPDQRAFFRGPRPALRLRLVDEI